MHHGPEVKDGMFNRFLSFVNPEHNEVTRELSLKLGVGFLCKEQKRDGSKEQMKKIVQHFFQSYDLQCPEDLLIWLEMRTEPVLIMDTVKSRLIEEQQKKQKEAKAEILRLQELLNKHEKLENELCMGLAQMSLTIEQDNAAYTPGFDLTLGHSPRDEQAQESKDLTGKLKLY